MQQILLETDGALSVQAAAQAIRSSLSGETFQGKRAALLIVPDYTRVHSNAGWIANQYYHLLEDSGIHVDLLEALGTHAPMTQAQCAAMYGDIPFSRFLAHDWRRDTVCIGHIPAAFIAELSEGALETSVPVELNRRLFQPDYGLILSIGQVVPHEVVGMSNQSKNLFVGCGGAQMIHASHMLGAVYGLERVMGRDFSPVRRMFDYAQAHFLSGLPVCYVLTVTAASGKGSAMHGLYIGRSRQVFEQAVAQAQSRNLIFVEHPLKKAVVYLDSEEFTSTWLGNKAIYRTRMAMADGGELFILAPGVRRFGEDAAMDALIRRYGYRGREEILRLCRQESALQENLSAAAHLIHGSSDGRFSITYCTCLLGREEVENAGYRYLPFAQAASRLDFARFPDGMHTVCGEDVYFISNPALGLWSTHARFAENLLEKPVNKKEPV